MHDNTGLTLCVREANGQENEGFMNAAINNYEDIVCIDAELSGYRRGCIRVKIDFDKKMVTWRDSLQWNNNFLRSISADKIQTFRTLLPNTHILQWKTHYTGLVSQDDANVCHPSDWAVVISFAQRPPLRILGSRQYPSEWHLFRDLIESITKIPFRLR